MKERCSLLLGFVLPVIVAGCNGGPYPVPVAQSADIVASERQVALSNVTSNFELNAYSRTVARDLTDAGHWSVVHSQGDCGSDEACFDVLFRMPGTADVPGWHFEFDRSSGELNRMEDIDESVNDRYFMLDPSSRGGGDTRP